MDFSQDDYDELIHEHYSYGSIMKITRITVEIEVEGTPAEERVHNICFEVARAVASLPLNPGEHADMLMRVKSERLVP